MRIPNAKNPLDASAVHPESYPIVEKMAADCGCTVEELIKSPELRKKVNVNKYVTKSVDPRVHTPEDLVPMMELPGIVTNITNFGAFVDVGVHQDGLVHISQLADKFVRDPNEVVKLHQHVRVRVMEVDSRRHRIALTMRGVDQRQ